MRSLTSKGEFCFYLIIIMFFSNSVHSGQSVSLSVTVIGGKPNKGKIIRSIFSSPENYLIQPVVENVLALEEKGEASVQIDDLQPGTYAISTVYDEDENGKLNTGFLGVPKELVGFSNNAKGTFGPPSFKATSFTHTRRRNRLAAVLPFAGSLNLPAR